MVELISKVSKGSKMDQIYIPKNRVGFDNGQYVVISPLKREIKETEAKLYFYNAGKLESIKMKIIEEIMYLISKQVDAENVVITGSFLDKGFAFNDVDILIINEKKINTSNLAKDIEELEGIKAHMLLLDNQSLSAGLSTDPLYNMMLSKCVSKNRLIFKVKRKINYKLLDLALLKSKTLIENFYLLNGKDKYYFTMNMISVLLFIQGKKLSKDLVNKEIENTFNVQINDLKDNLLEKEFLEKYKKIFNKIFNLILDSIQEGKNDKQK